MPYHLEKAISTGEVAKLCNTTAASVNNWIKAGKLKSYNTPGGQYRLLVGDLINFIKINNMPIPVELKEFFRDEILIIEDEQDTIDLFESLISEVVDSAKISVAKDGYSGLLKAGEIVPKLIFLDIQLPEMDGLEVCKRIKSNEATKDCIIFIVSGFVADPSISEKLSACNAEQILSKPIDVQHVQRLVKDVLPG